MCFGGYLGHTHVPACIAPHSLRRLEGFLSLQGAVIFLHGYFCLCQILLGTCGIEGVQPGVPHTCAKTQMPTLSLHPWVKEGGPAARHNSRQNWGSLQGVTV